MMPSPSKPPAVPASHPKAVPKKVDSTIESEPREEPKERPSDPNELDQLPNPSGMLGPLASLRRLDSAGSLIISEIPYEGDFRFRRLFSTVLAVVFTENTRVIMTVDAAVSTEATRPNFDGRLAGTGREMCTGVTGLAKIGSVYADA